MGESFKTAKMFINIVKLKSYHIEKKISQKVNTFPNNDRFM